MRLYPAIDMKNGQCVRLTQGLFDNVNVYSDSPADMAALWESSGARFLHLVDLDGALAGRSVNAPAIRAITERVKIPVQLGGGIRTLENIDMMLSLGVYRVIIGTRAVEDPEFVREAVRTFGAEHIVVGVDAKNGKVATAGWENVSSVDALDLCRRMEDMGVQTIVYTDISRDGMMQGPNVAMTKKISDAVSMDIIASGGVSCMEDLYEIERAGIHGAIMGKSLYEKKIDLTEAVKAFEIPQITLDLPFSSLKLGPDRLLPVVVQDNRSGEVLMVAYMNEEAYNATLQTGRMTYYSRSRKELWLKGDTSGHYQYVRSLFIDCDQDTLLAKVDQIGAACHTGNHSCFFTKIAGNSLAEEKSGTACEEMN